MSMALSGTGISKGLAIGSVQILQRGQLEVAEHAILADQIPNEISRFFKAVRIAEAQLRKIRDQIPKNTPTEIAEFIDTHLLMIKDKAISEAPTNIINTLGCNAEWALKLQQDVLVGIFNEMDDPYLRTRKDDVEHVVARIQRILIHGEQHSTELGETIKQGNILVADDLTPADTVQMQQQGIIAFITEYGGPLSHTAILARSLAIPALVGVRQARSLLQDGETVIVDSKNSTVISGADQHSLKYYRNLQKVEKRYRAKLTKLKQEPAVTLDGREIQLCANIELPEDVPLVNKVGADGVGLYRTEFLYMNRTAPPDEQEQLKAYVKLVRSLKGGPATIRTLDLGADKQVDGTDPVGRTITNPALGLRAIRLCLKDLRLFRTQLRAILRASAYGPVRLMIPMLSNLNELAQVRTLLDEIKLDLQSEKLKFDPDMPIGGMIEVPAAALTAKAFAKNLDFLSIGTNDLIQYTLAIDRVDDEVNHLYDPIHPAVLQLIDLTLKAGRKARIPVSMCGEMAGDKRFTRLLLGLGLENFSMHPSLLLEIKQVVKNSNVAELTLLAKKILKKSSSNDIHPLLEKMNAADAVEAS